MKATKENMLKVINAAARASGITPADRSASAGGAWSDYQIIHFKDGSQRRIKSGLEPMVDGIPRGVVPSSYKGMAIDANHSAEARVMRLHGYGNAINLPLAIEFVKAVMEELGT